MSNLIVPQSGELAFMGDIQAALATIITATKLKVKLYTNNYVPIPTSVIADFTEATFTGYAAQDVPTLGTPFINADGQAEFDCASTNVWTATDAVTPETVYGYWIEDTTGPSVLRWAERFDAPVDMTSAGKTLLLLLRLLLASMF